MSRRSIRRAAARGAIFAALMVATVAGSRAAPAGEPSDAHAAGRAVYTKWCAPCHDPGVIHPGTNALTAKYRGLKTGVLLERKDLTAEMVKYFVRHGVSVMPQFRQTEISDVELGALARFLSRNAD